MKARRLTDDGMVFRHLGLDHAGRVTTGAGLFLLSFRLALHPS